jgi:hypothetical protein|tara:strand:+ start:372 stop:566 length:195 start_codon:yes stop_codon:yes gene_type:complete
MNTEDRGLAMALIYSPKAKQDASKQLNPLNTSEIESLRREMKQDGEWAKAQLRQRKARRDARQA